MLQSLNLDNRHISWRVVHRVYAYKAKLGWCIIGPCGTKLGESGPFICNWIVLKEEGSGHLANHHFIHKDEIKDVGVEEMFQKMHNQGFSIERSRDRIN